MGVVYTLPFAGENKLASAYGWRTLNGVRDFHSGWDWHPMEKGVKKQQALCYWAADGKVDWLQNWDGKTKTGNMSYGNCERAVTPDKTYMYMAHLYDHMNKYGDSVKQGGTVGLIGPKTTGNSTGNHLHAEFRVGGTSTSKRVCPGEMYGLANVADVTYDSEKMDEATIGYLDCTNASYRWRTGAGTNFSLYKPSNTGSCMYCRVGVKYRVYAVIVLANGETWCQITPSKTCITKGSAPTLWVSAACGTYEAKKVPDSSNNPDNPNDKANWDADSNEFVVSASKGDREHLRNACNEKQLPVRNL